MILVTGGAGFIGSNFVLDWLSKNEEPVITLDKLTYAGNLQNLASVIQLERHRFVKGDIGDQELVRDLLRAHNIRAVVNFAAESHVDRSILGASEFIDTNIVGTFKLLEAVRIYFEELGPDARTGFRFLHVSTDEVYGTLKDTAPAFTESNRYETPIAICRLKGSE